MENQESKRKQKIFAVVNGSVLPCVIKSETNSTYFVTNLLCETQFPVSKDRCYPTEQEANQHKDDEL
jgi:hypothetical protein